MKNCPNCWGTGRKINHAKLGRFARSLRVKRGLTLKEGAKLLGVTESFLSYLECGKRSWSERLYQIALSGRSAK